MKPALPLVIAAALASLGASACSGSSASTPADTPPAISALNLNPTTVPVGKVTQVQGTVAFSDSEGDVSQVAIVVTPENGPPEALTRADAQGAAGQTAGTLAFILSIGVPTAETVTVQISVFDKAENESNRLTAPITAQ